jgi:hypothetical protein
MQMRTYRIVLCAAVLLPLLASAALAQQTPEPEKGPVVKVQVVLSRYEQQPTGERRTSSLPFTMLATSNGDKVSVRTGTQVPIQTQSADKVVNFQYVDVGSSIDCTVKTAANGRFNVILMVQDRSALDKPETLGSGANVTTQPILRNFTYTNSILLKDGESKQFVAASDKGSGDIVKVDVTINVEK